MPRAVCFAFVCIVLITLALGCGQEYTGSEMSYSVAPTSEAAQPGSEGDDFNLALLQDQAGVEEGAPANAGERPRLERRIIYNATLDLVVEGFSAVAGKVEGLATQFDGFIANSSIDTASHRPRRGSWTIRVPAARYDEFLAAAGTLGELQRRTESSREVTAEYYDLQTRIRNKDVEEKRLLKHLEESTGKLEEILAVEKEISRVRTEMEQMQGQLRVLQDLTALSTVTLNVSEIQGYVPAESPTFGTRIGRAWSQSLDGLVTAGQALVIVIVALAPWLPVIAVPVVGTVLLFRRLLRGKDAASAR